MADVSAALKDWSATSASNAPSGATTIGTGLDDNLREIQGAIVRGLSNKGADIASATTTDLGAVEGLMHDITGTTTITGFGTVRAGIWKIVKFEGVLTLTHNSTSLILPNGTNITTADGDIGIFVSEGSGNWRCVSYTSSTGYLGGGLTVVGAIVGGGSGTTSVGGVNTKHTLKNATASQFVATLDQSNASSPFGLGIKYSGATPNGTSSHFFYAEDSTAQRFGVRSNGGIENFSANDVNLSDIRTKKDVQLAGGYLEKICAIPVKTFLYNDQKDGERNLGVIAQDVESVAPELVDSSGFGKTPDDGVPLKAIYQTDLQYALMKAIQELAARVAELETK